MTDTNERLDKMSIWAAKVEKQLASITAKLSEPTAETDVLIEEVSGMYELYGFIPEARKQRQIELIDIDMEVKLLKENIADFEDGAYLDISMIMGDGGKLAYTNETMRNAAAKKTLKKDERYLELVNRFNDAERNQRIKKAELDQLSDLEKEYSRRNRAIVAQVEYVTAKITGA